MMRSAEQSVQKSSPIRVYGDPILSRRAAPVTEFDESLKDLVRKMHAIMIAAPGVGLAAPQIGVSQHIAIVDVSVGKDPEQLHVLVNPEIVAREGHQKGEEGCLSFPDITTVIDRPETITVKMQDLGGQEHEITVEGFLARAFCHEIDHLNGTLIIDRISHLKREFIKKKISKRMKAGTWTP